MYSPSDLIERWKTSAGIKIRQRVIDALCENVDVRPILRDLPGAEEVFDWTDFRGIDLSGLRISTGMFVAASVDFARFENCRFEKTFFDNARLPYTNFDNAEIIDSQMTSVVLLHASFRGSLMTNVLLMGSEVSFSDFNQAKISRCDFSRCRCLCDRFTSVGFDRVNFDEAKIARASFEGAHAVDCNFDRAQIIESVLPK